ncbi:hypothetical protein VDGL01_11135 [Verticillium dahliae]
MRTKASVADARPINSNPCPPHSTIRTPVTRPSDVLRGTIELTEVMNIPDDFRAMSPKMTCEETEALGREIQAERRWLEKSLQDSLLFITSHIEEVNKEHEKLARNNNVLQEYIGLLKQRYSLTR